MTVEKLRAEFRERLKGLYEPTEIDTFFYWLSEKFLEKDRMQVSLARKAEVPQAALQQFEEALHQLLQYVPIQYILGETEFYGLRFKVSPAVLIPRPETEELVSWVLDDFVAEKRTTEEVAILDLCTGSGCIAVALAKKLPMAKVSALDVSAEALKVARKNAKINQVEVAFAEANLLKMEELAETFDVMVSNPPYVRELEKAEISENVKAHEPGIALFVSDGDPLVFYRKIAGLAKKNLISGGSLYVEINQYLAEETGRLFEEFGFENVTLKNDMFNKPRMIKATKP